MSWRRHGRHAADGTSGSARAPLLHGVPRRHERFSCSLEVYSGTCSSDAPGTIVVLRHPHRPCCRGTRPCITQATTTSTVSCRAFSGSRAYYTYSRAVRHPFVRHGVITLVAYFRPYWVLSYRENRFHNQENIGGCCGSGRRAQSRGVFYDKSSEVHCGCKQLRPLLNAFASSACPKVDGHTLTLLQNCGNRVILV